jgi:hypothetical protein
MRRITELGDLNFSNPRGVFLPRSETMEEIGASWRQELDVAGTVQASREDTLLEGQINHGRAVAVYTPVGFETVETPLGSKEALRVRQRLDLELNIDFDLGGQVIPATEVINLNNDYWFARDIGLVKMHWLGGTTQLDAEIGQAPVSEAASITALSEDQLVSVCVQLTDQSIECAQQNGFSEAGLTMPPQVELAIQGLALSSVGGNGNGESAVVGETGTSESPGEPATDDDARSNLLAYAAAVESLTQQNSEAAEEFWEVALKYQIGELTLDEFRSESQNVATRVRGLIQQLDQLSPPPVAELVHRQLADGMAKCDQALDLMDAWFDAPNDNTREAATSLVTGCVEQVTAAGEELEAIVGQN